MFVNLLHFRHFNVQEKEGFVYIVTFSCWDVDMYEQHTKTNLSLVMRSHYVIQKLCCYQSVN